MSLGYADGGAEPEMPQGPQPQGSGRKTLDQMNDREVIALIDKWFDRVIANRRHIERDTLLNLAFLLDQQYVVASKVGNSLRLTPEKPKRGRVQTIEQIIEPIVRREVARLLDTKPQGVVIPRGQDPHDFEAAQAAEDVHQHVLRTHYMEDYQEDAALWMITGGTAHLGTHWDSMAMDDEGNQGDYKFRSLSPFEFGVPHIRKWRLEDQPYVMVTKAYELDEIQDIWGIRVEKDRDTKFGAIDDRVTSILSQGSQHSGKRGSVAQDQKADMAIVKEVWIKPSGIAPQGAVVVVASGTILDMMVWPEWCRNQYPFAKQEYTRIPGSYWGKPLISSLVPIQRRHNRAASIIIENMNIASRVSVAAPRNTQVRSVLGGRGVLFETPLGAPGNVTNIQSPAMGDLPFRELDNTRMAARSIASQHEVTQGYTPPNVRSGTAISALKQADDSASVIPVRSIERAAQKIGRLIINIAQTEWDEERLILILGEEGDIERHSFITGNDIDGQFTILPGSGWPYSKEQKQQLVFTALEAQLLTPDEALKHLELGSVRGIIQERNVDLRHARRENQKFRSMSAINPETGEPDIRFIHAQFQALLPADWHHHEVHLHIHNQERKSPMYEQWDTWKKALFEAHIAGHEAVLKAQMEAQMGMEQEA